MASSSSNTNAASGGVGFLSLLGLIFITLKLVGSCAFWGRLVSRFVNRCSVLRNPRSLCVEGWVTLKRCILCG